MFSQFVKRRRLFLRALGYFRRDSLRITTLLILITASTLLNLAQIWPMALLVDSVLSPAPRHGWSERWLLEPFEGNLPAQIALLAGGTLLLRLAQEILNLFRWMTNAHVTHDSVMRVRFDLFRKLQALHLHFHQSRPQGDTIYRLTDDAVSFQTLLDVLVNSSVAAVTLIVMLAILLSRSIELTVISAMVVPLLLAANAWFGRRLKSKTTAAKEGESHVTASIQRALTSIGMMQAFGREAVEYTRFCSTANSSTRAWLRYHWQEQAYRFCCGMIFGGGAALIFGCGAYMVYRDQFVLRSAEGMTVGDLIIFTTYLGMFYEPLYKISATGGSVQSSMAGIERVFEVLDRQIVVADAAGASALPRQSRTLSFDHVAFAYPAGNPVLRDVNVTVRPGEMVAFVGASGVGKSTLLNLLPRFYDPTEGAMRLDGHDLRDLKLRDVRQHIAIVLQESMLLPTTIGENIVYGRPEAGDQQIRQAAEQAGAKSFIESMPRGYETPVDEGGKNLSGGQRQRIAIARALLTEAPIIVLDEPTSALDPQHEQLLTQTLRHLKGQRTLVLVSHRLSTVVDCDQIYVMDGGRIVEHGKHHELLERRGKYFEMASHQMSLHLGLPGCADGQVSAA